MSKLWLTLGLSGLRVFGFVSDAPVVVETAIVEAVGKGEYSSPGRGGGSAEGWGTGSGAGEGPYGYGCSSVHRVRAGTSER